MVLLGDVTIYTDVGGGMIPHRALRTGTGEVTAVKLVPAGGVDLHVNTVSQSAASRCHLTVIDARATEQPMQTLLHYH